MFCRWDNGLIRDLHDFKVGFPSMLYLSRRVLECVIKYSVEPDSKIFVTLFIENKVQPPSSLLQVIQVVGSKAIQTLSLWLLYSLQNKLGILGKLFLPHSQLHTPNFYLLIIYKLPHYNIWVTAISAITRNRRGRSTMKSGIRNGS